MNTQETIVHDLENPLLLSAPQKNANNGSLVRKNEIVMEAMKQIKLAGPLMAVNFLLFSLQVISVMFVGHLGELPLAAASVATSFASVTGLSLLEWEMLWTHFVVYPTEQSSTTC